MFQSTPPREGRLRLTLALVRYKDVSIHAPREGRRGWKATFDWLFEFQSTPPTRGATEEYAEIMRLFKVSIHAPTRGATRLALYIQC